jgi:hypothetical protein
MLTVVEPAVNVAVAGTVATNVLLELRLTVNPPVGAAPDKVSVILFAPMEVRVMLGWGHATVAPTVTVWLDVV